MTTRLSIAEQMNRWESLFPDHWALCYPKQYQVSSTYPSPKQLAVNLMEFRAPNEDVKLLLGSTDKRLALLAASVLVKFKVPIFFVAPDLLAAVRMSVPPIDLDWIDMRLPFDSAAFALPRGSLSHTSRGDVSYLWYARIRKGQPYYLYPEPTPLGIADEDAFMVFISCMDRNVLSHIVPGSSQPTIPMKDLSNGFELIDASTLSRAGFVEDDMTLVSSAVTLLFSLLFVMSAREGLWERGQWTGKRSKRGLEFWTPNILGKDYVLKRNTQSSGSGASPRMHWRRGHMRQQPYGENHSLRRSQWIEPVLVAAER